MPMASTRYTLHTIFDDSLDAHWSLDQGSTADDTSSAFCARHLHLPLGGRHTDNKWNPRLLLSLRARSPMYGMDEQGIGLHIAFLATAPKHPAMQEALSSVPLCGENESRTPTASCTAVLCVAVLTNVKGIPRYVSACAVPDGSASAQWRRFRAPVAASDDEAMRPHLVLLGTGLGRSHLQNTNFSSSSTATAGHGGSAALLLDDLMLVSRRPPTRVSAAFFLGPPSAGAHYAAHTVPRTDADGGLGWCEYMSSDYRPGANAKASAARRRLPRCKMNGDHLRGRWLQNCDPASPTSPLRRRPDVYAYGHAMPRVVGKFDFRVCYRTSFWERERALQALSWTWRPYDCRLEPFHASAFDAWLGNRTVVIVGDSLSAQLYYSIVLLLGNAVVETVEHADGMRRTTPVAKSGAAASSTAHGQCTSGVADEGPSSFSEVRLSQGGRVVKVLGHTRYIQELQHVERAPWLRFVTSADFLVLSIGHHYRSVDRTFAGFDAMVSRVEASLRDVMKPSAHVIVRSTNVGHRGCENATRPLQDRRAAWERLAERPGGAYEWSAPSAEVAKRLEAGRGNPNSLASARRDPFDWRAPPLHEGAWARVFGTSTAFRHRFTLLNVSFVDARVDGHVANAMRYSDESERKAHWGGGLDCLHYCFPGPADFWSLSLFNLLVQLA